ncbi:MAG: hypothetical protein IJ151_07390 [Bacteroidales bacterium]|nr:hypothetical protein [Bacteroidales bacterium]
MTDLEKYIKENGRKMDMAEPSAGHEDRFLDKLERAGKPAASAKIVVWRRFMAVTSLAAAVIIGIILIKPGAGGSLNADKDWFADAGDSPQAIFDAYYSQYRQNCTELAEYGEDETLAAITREAIPLLDQLPDELSDQEKGEILRSYYGTMLTAMNDFKDNIKN